MTPMLEFPTARKFRAWLAKNHRSSGGIWLRIHKKDSDQPSIRYPEALDEALCFGWIDGQKKSHDARSFLQKFTPRRPRSLWSKRNIEHCERLIAEGRMEPAGLQQIEAAKADGRWSSAYDPPSRAAPPADLLEALARNRRARAFFGTLDRTNLYAILWRLQTAKRPETRARRIEAFVDMLASGKKIHP
jgi:uncharacterized protein YdeI (YjbR/CyaY-like superfamily)